MIRDPSDGSVKSAVDHQPKPLEEQIDRTETGELITGLREPPRSMSERLAYSRNWLKEYHASRNPEKVVREKGE